jgi:hypothetical protein
MQSNSHAHFGTFDEMEHVAAALMAQGYTQTDRFEQRCPKQDFFGPNTSRARAKTNTVLLWQSD